MNSASRRRSVVVSGHRTSVSVEPAFWQELTAIANDRGLSINALVSEIDADRSTSLSSAIRLYVLETLKSRARPRASSPSRPRGSG